MRTEEESIAGIPQCASLDERMRDLNAEPTGEVIVTGAGAGSASPIDASRRVRGEVNGAIAESASSALATSGPARR
jgi:hypothetical protein